jgi:hypothetical protein
LTELRVHGFGGTPPAAVNGEQAPELASGNQTAGFYRISDHRASAADQEANRDVDRQVEVYVPGGLTFTSRSRVLWLVLLPFLLSNMAGWMCSSRTRQSRWRFRLHRLAYGLCALALTVNAFLVAAVIFADVMAYQVTRAGLAGRRWWTAPLGWDGIAGHPARQVLLGMLVPVLILLVLAWVTGQSLLHYEATRPPNRASARPAGRPRMVTAAALKGGLADSEFWDGESSGRLLARVHAAVTAGFLAIVLSVTVTALTRSSHAVQVVIVARIAVGLGAATIAAGVGYVCLDALGTSRADMPGADRPAGTPRAQNAFVSKLRGWIGYLPAPAGAALAAAGIFAWLQQGGVPEDTAGLPGMAGVIGWTALAIAVPVTAALASVLLGLPRRGRALFGGPWIVLMLAFSLLNIVMLGAGTVVARFTGPVTSDAAVAVLAQPGRIYLPYVITYGVPLAAWASIVAGLAFAQAEASRWLRTRQLPAAMRDAYREEAQAFMNQQPESMKRWYDHGVPPPDASGDTLRGDKTTDWEIVVARARIRGSALLHAGWLLWMIIIAQIVTITVAWRSHAIPQAIITTGLAAAILALAKRRRSLPSRWQDLAQRTMAIFWDVGTFWPRSYHPFSPPCYAERAVPDLQRRMWMLHDLGRKLLLVAHGQGTMVAAAALAQPGCRPENDRPALVTLGSTVGRLYSRGFPAYVTPELLASLEPGGTGRLQDWRNLYYPTDPIAGPAAVNLSSADRGPVDQSLSDPPHSWWIHGQDPPVPRGHLGYWDDPRVGEHVNQVAAAAWHIPAAAAASQPGDLAARPQETA